jgi:AraC-like DNA-binding protein
MDTKILKAKTRKEVAEEYSISPRTLARWFKKANLQTPPGLIDPYHIKIIYKTFGVPKNPKVI